MQCTNALMLAARDGQWEVVKTLLHRGTHVDIVDSEQRTPLMMAASEDHSSIVELLLDNGKKLIYYYELQPRCLIIISNIYIFIRLKMPI